MTFRTLRIKSQLTDTEIAELIKGEMRERFSDIGEEYTVRITVKPVGAKAKKSIYYVGRDPVMKMATDYVKKRDGYQCRKTGESIRGKNCHSAHIFSRRINELRYDPDNMLTLSMLSHRWFDENRNRLDDNSEQTKFLIEQIGLEQLNRLRIRSQIFMKRSKAEFDWRCFYEQEAKC